MGRKEHLHTDLIEASRQGSEKARYQLYRLYSKAMFNVCCRLMGNREDAEDMLQEAFARAFRQIGTFRFESEFGAWLKRITVNTCINALNKRKVELIYCDEIHNPIAEQEQETPAEFTTADILKAMNQLPDGGRMVFSLYLLEGYDHGEIAQIMNITESTSKSQFMRAKRRIVEILETQLHEDEKHGSFGRIC